MGEQAGFRPIDTDGFASIDRPADFGPVPDQRWLPIARLVVDPSYQRDVQGRGRSNVRRIAEGFSWSKFSAVVCSPVPGGFYAIIDGQHRTTAAALLGFADVPCQVIVANQREQAQAFSAINGNTTAMSSLALFAARVASGDETASAIREACEGCGVTVLRYPVAANQLKPGQTMASGAIQRIWSRHGSVVLITTLKTIMESSNGEDATILRAAIISAVADVLADHVEWRDAGGRLIDAFDDLDLDSELTDAQERAHRRPGVTAGAMLQARLVEYLSSRLG